MGRVPFFYKAILMLSMMCVVLSSVLGRADATSADFVRGLFVGLGIVGCVYGLVKLAKSRGANG